jgi:Putative metallopeptidase
VARTAINGAAFYWMTSWGGGDWFPHFDTHSTGSQRAATFLCLGYGGDSERFKDLVEKRWLSKERSENCGREYQQVRLAFRTSMLPYVDQELLKKVQGIKWLRPDEGKW